VKLKENFIKFIGFLMRGFMTSLQSYFLHSDKITSGDAANARRL